VNDHANFRLDDVFSAEGLRLPQSLHSFAMTLGGYLKKQSQFTSRQIGVKSYLKGIYGDNSLWGTKKQTQFKIVLSAVERRRFEG